MTKQVLVIIASLTMATACTVETVDGADICETSDDCPEGQMCIGAEDCGPATCQPERPCTRDYIPLCGCDGEVLHDSSSCPSQSFDHTGYCEVFPHL